MFRLELEHSIILSVTEMKHFIIYCLECYLLLCSDPSIKLTTQFIQECDWDVPRPESIRKDISTYQSL